MATIARSLPKQFARNLATDLDLSAEALTHALDLASHELRRLADGIIAVRAVLGMRRTACYKPPGEGRS